MCGPACLRAVLLYWGTDVSEKKLAVMTGWTERIGTPAEGLAAAAQQLGFAATVQPNSTLDDLTRWASKGVPTIVEWFSTDDGHYSVVIGVHDDRIWLMDPYEGENKSMETDSFLRRWFDFEDTNNVLGFIRRQMIIIAPK